ncbi:hypothetical protein T484DRAFT_3590792 [Baffinella frigidus]|nr:hypothetical protein T484DRAFT_3590792 [Cryptophyta sp. CCMP2293]
MTEVRLWSSERTSGEISADWNKRISGMAEDLVAVWPLNCSWEFLAAGGSSSLSGLPTPKTADFGGDLKIP